MKAGAIPRHERIVADIGRAAQRILDNDDPKAEIDGAQDRREHADVRLCPGDDDRADSLVHQQAREAGIAECRIGRFVDDGRRRNEAAQGRHEFETRWRKMLAGRLAPETKIALPLSGPIFRIFGRDESREDRSGLMARNDRGDRRQYSRHPWRRPETAGSEDVLHVDAQVNGVADAGHFRLAVSHRPSLLWARSTAFTTPRSEPLRPRRSLEGCP